MVAASVIRPEEVRPFTRFSLWLAAILSGDDGARVPGRVNPYYALSRCSPGLVIVPADLGSIDYSGRTDDLWARWTTRSSWR